MKIRSPLALAVALACSLAATTASADSLGAMSSAARAAAPSSDIHQVGSRGRNTALGIGAIIGTVILLNEAARADGHRRYHRTSSCGRLLYQCEDGRERSCRRYENRCM
jgi:hypothetical protein